MIQFFDKYMNEIPDIEFIEVAWNRKWKEPGTFSVYTSAIYWDERIKYVKNSGRPETGIVQKVVVERKAQGTFVTASGFFAEKVLDWLSIWTDYNIYATKEEHPAYSDWVSSKVGAELLNANALKQEDEPRPTFVKGVFTKSDSKWPNPLSISTHAGETVKTLLYDYLNQNNMSCYVEIQKNENYFHWAQPWLNNPSEPHFIFLVGTIEGRELSKNVIFGEGYQNAAKIEYVYDDSGAFPYFVIRQTMETTGFTNEEVVIDDSGNRKGRIHEYLVEPNNRPRDLDVYPRKIIEGNVAGIELKPENEKIIREQLKKQALTEMLNHYKQEVISVDVIQNTFYYLKDYDLGDICSIAFDEIQKMFKARIVEIHEVHRKNTVEIQLVFGTPKKQQYIQIAI